MFNKTIFVLILYITSIFCAPVKLQFIPLQYGMQPQNLLPSLNPFLKQGFPNLQSPFMYPQQPMVLLMPNIAPVEADDRYLNLNEENATSLKRNTGQIDEANDAIILDAEANSKDENIKKTTVMMANGARFSLGDIISYIPFLPIEINVPDTISWIAGLFPGNWFGRPGQKPENIKRFTNKGPMPILVFPAPMMQ